MSAEFRLSDEQRGHLRDCAQISWEHLYAAVSRIVASEREAAERALVERCQQFYAWWREQPRVIGSGESDRLRAFGDLLHDHLTRPDIGATP